MLEVSKGYFLIKKWGCRFCRLLFFQICAYQIMCWIFYFSLTFFYRNKRTFFLFFFLSPRRFFCHYYFHPVYFREYKKPPKQSDIHRHTINYCQYINKVNYARSTEYSWIERTTATGMHWWTKTSFYRFKCIHLGFFRYSSSTLFDTW